METTEINQVVYFKMTVSSMEFGEAESVTCVTEFKRPHSGT